MIEFIKKLFGINSHKRTFKREIDKVQQTIWMHEYLLHEMREMYEERRKARDYAMESIDALTKQLEKDNTEDTIEKLEAQKDEQIAYKEKVENDLAGIDSKINSSVGTPDAPQGGLLFVIESLRTRKQGLENYLKTL
jgi:hypothetical protein